MARITLNGAQGWADRSKLTLSTLDLHLLDSIETEVISRLSSAYDTTTWLNADNTPAIVQVVICKYYVSWIYERAYSENQDSGSDYAAMLRVNAEMLISGLLDGTIDIPGVTPIGSGGGPAYYPNDASSALEPTFDDMSLGPAKFSMGKVF
jgi:hypothetical protein